ncbi:MAG: hypothetical protein QW327_04590 [Candidatus Odinarchaeota archaeon]
MGLKDKRIPVELKVINTPKGEVPTVESFKNLVNGLNILDSEIESLRGEYLKLIEEVRRDVKSVKKLVMDNTISLESVNEKLVQLNKTLSESLSNENASINTLRDDFSKALNDLLKAQRNLEESFVKSIESISKIVGLKLSARKEG